MAGSRSGDTFSARLEETAFDSSLLLLDSLFESSMHSELLSTHYRLLTWAHSEQLKQDQEELWDREDEDQVQLELSAHADQEHSHASSHPSLGEKRSVSGARNVASKQRTERGHAKKMHLQTQHVQRQLQPIRLPFIYHPDIILLVAASAYLLVLTSTFDTFLAYFLY